MRIIKSEFIKYWGEVRRYYPDQIVDVIICVLLFSAFFVGVNDSNELLYVGFFYWFFAQTVLNEASVTISFEKQVGTFEQLATKPTKLITILVSRTFIWLCASFVKLIIIMPILILLFKINLVFNLLVIPIFIVTIIGLLGLGIAIASFTLLYTKTASFQGIVSYLLLLFTGAVIPLENLPNIFTKISYFIPLSLGIEISKNIIAGNQVAKGDVIFLLLNSFIYIVMGMLLFNYTKRISKKDGLNLDY